MTDYEFPLGTARSFAERLEGFPAGVSARRWVLRDDNQQHYHGRIPLAEDPAYLELRWKHDGRSRDQLVGLYRLHLAELAKAGYARVEGDPAEATELRLRVVRGDRGLILVQARQGEPALPIGTVDTTLY